MIPYFSLLRALVLEPRVVLFLNFSIEVSLAGGRVLVPRRVLVRIDIVRDLMVTGSFKSHIVSCLRKTIVRDVPSTREKRDEREEKESEEWEELEVA